MIPICHCCRCWHCWCCWHYQRLWTLDFQPRLKDQIMVLTIKHPGVTCCLDAPFSTDTSPETTLPDNPHSRKTRHISLYLEPGLDYRLPITVLGSTLTNDPPHNHLPPEPLHHFNTVCTMASRLKRTFYRGQ